MALLKRTFRWAFRLWIGAALALDVIVLTLSLWVARASDCCSLSEQEPAVQKKFPVSGVPELDVRNITGPIHVIGDSEGEIRLTGNETVRANSKDDIERGKREVRLNILSQGKRVVECVQQASIFGFGSGNDDCESSHFNLGNPPYRVRFDFELHVPKVTKVNLNTVDDGDIRVESVSGGFEVHNVNGGVDLEGMGGAGHAATVNGEVKTAFAANPVADCGFSTVNGSVHLYFRPELSTMLRYATVNGDVYTDFPVTAAGEETNGTVAFGTGQAGSDQIGSGGPRIQVSTVNGAIFVHRAQ